MKKRHFMRKREAKDFLEKISDRYGEVQTDKVEFAEYEEKKIYLIDDELELIEDENGLYPFLGGSLVDRLPYVTVDMGAVRFVCNGADVMAPGIIDLDVFSKGETVIIRDISYKKALAVGIALESSENIESSKKGKVISNLHYIGDKLWNKLA